MVVTYADVPYMTNYYGNGFTSLDKFFEYYQKVVEKMDEYVGLEFNPEKITDQNVRTKYLIKANRHGVGAAYYAGDHVGVNNESMRSFFEMNWGGLHELAHGYQGSLGKGAMQLGEVANNIIGHYIQIDKSIYFHQGNWLGNLADIEEDRNANRLAGKTFLEIDEPTKSAMSGNEYVKIFNAEGHLVTEDFVDSEELEEHIQEDESMLYEVQEEPNDNNGNKNIIVGVIIVVAMISGIIFILRGRMKK